MSCGISAEAERRTEPEALLFLLLFLVITDLGFNIEEIVCAAALLVTVLRALPLATGLRLFLLFFLFVLLIFLLLRVALLFLFFLLLFVEMRALLAFVRRLFPMPHVVVASVMRGGVGGKLVLVKVGHGGRRQEALGQLGCTGRALTGVRE